MVIALRPFFKKRTILLCAFLVCGCTDSSQTSAADTPSLDKESNTTDMADSRAIPLLTLSELLSASDVKVGLSTAAANNDEELLLEWQKTLLAAAQEVNLLDNEKNLIEGDQGLNYLAFQGMKLNYQTAFHKAFVSFEDLDEVYKAYPAFQDLHQRSSQLVEQRDALIEAVAKDLQSQNFDGDAYAEAKRQWQVYIKAQVPFSP